MMMTRRAARDSRGAISDVSMALSVHFEGGEANRLREADHRFLVVTRRR